MNRANNTIYNTNRAEEYERLCNKLDDMDAEAREHGFYAVRSAIATQRELLKRDLDIRNHEVR